MSRHSKAKRDARRQKSPGNVPRRGRPALEPHAELTVDRAAVGVVARQGDEWVLFLDGRPVASTDSAAMTMAMLKRVATVREGGSGDVRLAYSTTLRAAATLEAESQGRTLHAYLEQLEAERESRLEEVADVEVDPANHRDTDAVADVNPIDAEARIEQKPRIC